MRLRYRFAEDWQIYAQADDGSWWATSTETWPEWLDAAEHAGLDPYDDAAVEQMTQDEDSTERHMVPRITAWDSDLSPTASPVSHPTGEHLGGIKHRHRFGVVGFPRWEPITIPDDIADLDKFAAEIPLGADGTTILGRRSKVSVWGGCR